MRLIGCDVGARFSAWWTRCGWALAASTLFSACGAAPPAREPPKVAPPSNAITLLPSDPAQAAEEIRIVKSNLERDLFDPFSVRYRNTEVVLAGGRIGTLPADVPQMHIYCGEINAKNRLGAYTGFQHFASFAMPQRVDQHADIDDPSTGYHSIGWEVFCKGKTGTPVTF